MNNLKLHPLGFSLSWNFYNEEEEPSVAKILDNLESVLSICQKYELLIPTHYLDDDLQAHAFGQNSIKDIIAELREKIETKELYGEIVSIGGEGLVYLGVEKTMKQKDLLTIESIRLYEQNLTIQARVNCWTPLAMDTDYNFHWQIELALFNEDRLERCLREIHEALGAEVEPEEGELDRDEAIWQKGFQLFWNPEILEREHRNNPPSTTFDFKKYILDN